MKPFAILSLLLFLLTTPGLTEDIFEASKRGRLNDVKAMLKSNSGLVHSTDKEERTPLHLAAEYGRLEVVKFLIQKGAKVDARDKSGSTALHQACDSPASKESAENKLKTVKFLIQKGADIEALTTTRRKAPLHTAAHSWDHRVAEYLIKKGARVDLKDGIGWTPLFWAAHNRFPRTLKALIKNGADVNAQDNSGETALHWTVRQKSTEVTKILIKEGADPNIADKSGVTPLDKARKQGRKDMEKVLTGK